MALVAFVLLREAELAAAEDVETCYGMLRRPGGARARCVGEGTAEKPVESWELGDAQVLVATLGAPVPGQEAEDAATRSLSRFSPDGSGALPPHRAQRIVSLTGSGAPPLGMRNDFTRFVAALARTSDAVGVYWGDGHVAHPTRFFVQAATSDAKLPLPVWLGVSVAGSEDRIDLLTTGMGQFGLQELRLTAPRKQANEAVERLFDLAAYAVERGAVVPDGETVGLTPNDRNRVRHEPSPIDRGETVWRVDLGSGSLASRILRFLRS